MSAGCVIGVDLGGTKLLAGAVGADLTVRHRAARSARGADQHEVIDTLVASVEEIRGAAGDDVVAVGVGVPSQMDFARGVALSTVHLPIADVPLRDVLAERLGLPVFVDNDANAALLAEHRHGAAAGTRHAVMLTLGTGVGGGVLVEGVIMRGVLGAAGELGHMVIDADGPPCFGSCPNRGCLEALASGSALGRDALAAAQAEPSSALGRALAEGQQITGALATELAHDGDPAAGALVGRLGSFLGVGIANLVNIFNPEVVVVGGGVIAAGELLLGPARAVVAQRALGPSRDAARVVPAHFGAESGMLGAAALAFDGLGA
jgi:glucokinase